MGLWDRPPKDIQFEITESVFIKNYKSSVNKLARLREIGFSISLDDFGTGFSSLNSLWKLPIDEVKIDKSFIDNMSKDGSLFTMVQSIITLCKKLKLTVVAEGVENNLEFMLLKGLGCDVCQGYYVDHPLTELSFSEKYVHD